MTTHETEQHNQTEEHGQTSTALAHAPIDEHADPGPLFNDEDLHEFDRDDVQAGSAIGKMLSLFFLYTVIAMTIVGCWTVASVFGD